MRVGILCGRERAFPDALIGRINEGSGGVRAEMIQLNGTRLDDPTPYSVILDRISHEVPYYRVYTGKAIADGAVVINNPFWWSADNKFLECILARRVGISVPRTVLLPNVTYEADIIDASLRNLGPIDWDAVIEYVGLPAVLKPVMGGGNKNVSLIATKQELVAAHAQSGSLTMIVQERILYDNYCRCWVIGREHVRIAGYDHHMPRHERYRSDHRLSRSLHDEIVECCLTLTRSLGFDMDTVELGIRGAEPVGIDWLNPAPDCDPPSIGQDNFEWVVEHVAEMLISYATGEQRRPEPNWLALCGAVPDLSVVR